MGRGIGVGQRLARVGEKNKHQCTNKDKSQILNLYNFVPTPKWLVNLEYMKVQTVRAIFSPISLTMSQEANDSNLYGTVFHSDVKVYNCTCISHWHIGKLFYCSVWCRQFDRPISCFFLNFVHLNHNVVQYQTKQSMYYGYQTTDINTVILLF